MEESTQLGPLASVAGRRRASISAITSMAVERRAAGVMGADRWRPPSFDRLVQRRSPAGAERFMAANVLAHFEGGVAHLIAAKVLGHPALLNRIEHAPQQIVVVLVAVRFGIEILRQLGKPLVADTLDVLLHEPVVVAPVDAGGEHSRMLGAGGDLMSVKVMQPELIDQRLFHLLM